VNLLICQIALKLLVLSNLFSHLQQFQCSLYQFHQLINEPTRVTPTSAFLIDLILTNKPENISPSGVVHLGISDHSRRFFLLENLRYQNREKFHPCMVREVRDLK
jgi:hypothetical protein